MADDLIVPSVQAFLVCDMVIADAGTGKKSIIGTFTHISAKNFPCQHPKMALYVCITDADGSYQFEIELVYLNEDKIIGKARFPEVVKITNRLDIIDFGINIPPVPLPGPGRYEFRLFAEGRFLAQKDFNVIQANT